MARILLLVLPAIPWGPVETRASLPVEPPLGSQEASVEITPRTRAAIERGLAWLHRNQSRSGAFGSGSVPVATTSIAGMAFLAGGHVPGRSRYGDAVLRAVQFLLRMTSRSGYINEAGRLGGRGSGMHGHGYAVLFLSEVYGMCSGLDGFRYDSLEEELKEKLTLAVKVIVDAQAANGGWYYTPQRGRDEGSVTVTQVQALRAARNAGIKVDIRTIKKAVEYIHKSTGSNGLTRYSLTGSGRTSFALTAAGMSCLNFLGEYDHPKLKKGLDYVMQFVPKRGNSRVGSWYFYGHYYAGLATYQAKDGSYWKRWYPAIREELIQKQSEDGSWKIGESASYGPAFGTSFALQILQIPNRFLPIYQGGRD